MSSKTQFQKDFSRFLTLLKRNYPHHTSVDEFKRWAKENVMPFTTRSAHEQFEEKIQYEISLGADNWVLRMVRTFLNDWAKKNLDKKDPDYIWYHGTTEPKYQKILRDREIRVSTPETVQHHDYLRDAGTISLAKHQGHATFFSAISSMGKQKQVILSIDIRNFNRNAMRFRDLIGIPGGELLYSRNIPASAIIKAKRW